MVPKYSEKEFLSNFWEKVDKTSDASGCWLWTGCKNQYGYGSVKWNGKNQLTHRVAYLLAGHTIPEGLILRHSEHCIGKQNCCNPDHITPGTVAENHADMIRDGTSARGEKQHSAKLTAPQVLEIRRRCTENRRELGEEFGVSGKNISAIINRRSWNHLTE